MSIVLILDSVFFERHFLLQYDQTGGVNIHTLFEFVTAPRTTSEPTVTEEHEHGLLLRCEINFDAVIPQTLNPCASSRMCTCATKQFCKKRL